MSTDDATPPAQSGPPTPEQTPPPPPPPPPSQPAQPLTGLPSNIPDGQQQDAGDAPTESSIWSGGSLALQLLVTAGLALFFVALPAPDFAAFAKALGGGAVMLTATYAVGWVIGFLLGLPKVMGSADERYQASTNLEKLSDWLPTVLTGASLASASAIGLNVHAASEALGDEIGVHAVILDGLMAIGIAAGVVRGYLETRTKVQQSMKLTDDFCNVRKEKPGRGDVAPELKVAPEKGKRPRRRDRSEAKTEGGS